MGSRKPPILREVISLCKKRGFIFLNLTSKNGMKEVYTYGPLGAELKRNLINEWWYSVVTANEFVYPLSTPLLNNHVGTEFESSAINEEGQSHNDNLTISQDSLSLRHGLRQGALMHLYDCIKSTSLRVPFGLAETGKVFRKGPLCKHFLLTSREYDSVDLQFFCSPDEHRQWYSHWQKSRLQWWKKFANHPERFGLGEGEGGSQLRGTTRNDHNMYSTIQFEFPWGSHDIETFTNLGDSLLQMSHDQQLLGQTNAKDSVFKVAKVRGKKVFPCVLSIAGDIDGALLAYLCDAYTEVERSSGLHVKATQVLRLHRSLAPYKVAVLPEDSANKKLFMYCRKLSGELRLAGVSSTLNASGSLEERLQIQNEMGTPYRVLANEDTLESGVVRIQDRDTTIEEEVNGSDVLSTVMRFLRREL